ncbi:MAG: LysR family transcriptional regulator [Gammaproteobacteria bacterium]|nr:LysR family transcriptional regulator [Marinomonas sp. BSi20584]MBU1293546.1 LysR family transcriptional regulator [Gammaproteobacteria bacterium]MBU1466577.1 LysR family transcriptional regulator [Gammaproteobacteria bacterium]MBU2024667.1 LysR family transcriptional regulator [Gammaproteobacteria bacterium]MBU2239883.1 LysR family transcriptional regulator [Gammaproteobacteria bacterium]
MRSKTEDLEILLAVADHGGFSAAANALDIQVAKVSRAITRLEQEHACSLFTRTTRKVSLTQEGERFIMAIRSAMEQIAGAEFALTAQKTRPSGRLRIDAASPFVLHQLVPLIKPFRAAYPDIELELVSNDSIIDLIEKRTDLAIRIGGLSDSGLHATLLGRSILHLVASPDYLAINGIPKTVEELALHDIIGFSDIANLNKLPTIPPIQLSIDIKASSGETVRQLCLAGNGIALLSNFMVSEDIKAGRLISLLIESIQTPNPREQVNAVYYKHTALASRIEAFLNFIKTRLIL